MNHRSIVSGVRGSGARVRVFEHNNPRHLDAVLRSSIAQGQPRTHRPWKKVGGSCVCTAPAIRTDAAHPPGTVHRLLLGPQSSRHGMHKVRFMGAKRRYRIAVSHWFTESQERRPLKLCFVDVL